MGFGFGNNFFCLLSIFNKPPSEICGGERGGGRKSPSIDFSSKRKKNPPFRFCLFWGGGEKPLRTIKLFFHFEGSKRHGFFYLGGRSSNVQFFKITRLKTTKRGDNFSLQKTIFCSFYFQTFPNYGEQKPPPAPPDFLLIVFVVNFFNHCKRLSLE